MAKRWLGLLRENKRVAIVAACAIVFLVLLEDVLEGGLIKLDEAAYVLIVEHLRTDWLTPIMESISALATPVTLMVMLLLIVAFAPGRRPGVCCALNLALVVVLNQVLKFLVQRPRAFALRQKRGSASPRATRWPRWRSSACSSGWSGTTSAIARCASGARWRLRRSLSLWA